MANWARGLASGLETGYRLGEMLNQKRLRDALTEASKEQPYQAYSQATADQMRAEANELNPDGSYKYRFEIDPGSTQYRRVVNEYNPEDYRTDEYTSALRYPDAQGGLAPQPSAVAQAFPVDRGGLQVREDYTAYPGRVLTGGAPQIAPGSIQYGGTPVPMDQPEQAGLSRDLLTNAPEYSPALNIYDPRDTAAYQALTSRGPAEAGTYAPDREMYFGKSYGLGQLTPEEKRAAQQEQYANVYERLGQPEQAMAMRNAAAKERREAEMFGLQKETAQLQLGEAKRSIAQRENANSLSMALGELEKNGQPVDSARILELGAAYGLGPAEAGEVFVKRNGINQAIYENNKVLRAQLAQNVNTLDQAMNTFNKSPLFYDGTEMGYVPTGDGRVVITQKDKSGRVMFTSEPMTEGQALAMSKQRMMDPMAAENFAMTVATHNMSILKDRALINKYNSEARAAGVDTKSVSNMVSYQRSLQDQLKDLDAGLQALDPKSPAFAKEVARRKQLSELLEVTNAKLATELNLGGGAPASAQGASTAPTQGTKITRNGKTFEFQGGNPTNPNSWKEVQGAPVAPAPGGLASEKPKASPSIKPKVEGPSPALQKYGKSAESAPQKPVNVADDTVLSTINRELKKLGTPTPSNVVQVNALQRAKEERIKELQRRYGGMTQLITE